MKLSIAALLIGSAAGFSASSFSGSALKATGNDSTMLMATGMGVNGFGRIGRLGMYEYVRYENSNMITL
jgi:glyceraldehyde 3-phosphate dehydrogenase